MYDKNIMSGLAMESKKIFSLVLHKNALTKGSLAEISGLKLTTLKRMMQPLEDLGLIIESEIGESTGGRKPVLYDVNSKKYYIVGIDISRTYTQVIITNLKMDIVDKYRFEMNKESTPEMTLRRVLNWLEEASKKFKNNKGVIIGIGIGTVGPLDREKCKILNPANFEAKGWENIAFRAAFQHRLGVPVILDNGANAAVLAETYYGVGKGIRNIIYVNCGIGIRTGVISSEVFVRNINDAEDAFAHMVVNVEGEACRCGSHGCIERYASINAIVEEFISQVKKGKVSMIQKPVEQVSYIDICIAAEENDTVARQVLQNAAVIMGNGIANLIKLLNPGMIVLSGPLIKHSKLFYQICTETALKKSDLNFNRMIVFSRGGYYDENAISIGSAALVEHYLGNHVLN